MFRVQQELNLLHIELMVVVKDLENFERHLIWLTKIMSLG
jgi:hypothetical protein